MLYRIGTLSDCTCLSASLPEAVRACVARNVAILDREYGENRILTMMTAVTACLLKPHTM